MDKNKLTLNIKLKDIDVIKNLVELIVKHFNNLPIELQESLIEIEKTGFNDITADDIFKMFGSIYTIDSSLKKNIVKVNKILKKVVYFEDGEKIAYPETFYLKINDEIIMEW